MDPTAVPFAVTTGHADRSPVSSSHSDSELYRAHIADAIRLGFLLSGDLARGQDLAHDAFLKVAPRLGSLASPDRFRAYLRKAVVRGHLMDRRSSDRELRRLTQFTQEGLDRPVDGWSADRADLMAVLHRLPRGQRAVIVLRFWADLSEAEIASVLRCRPGTVKSNLSRGLAALRQELR